MKDVRIFVASSKELLSERNALAYFVLAHEDEFAKRGFRVRLSKWEYVDPKKTEERTEDRYFDEMLNCNADKFNENLSKTLHEQAKLPIKQCDISEAKTNLARAREMRNALVAISTEKFTEDFEETKTLLAYLQTTKDPQGRK